MYYHSLLLISYIIYIIFPLSLDGSCNIHSFFNHGLYARIYAPIVHTRWHMHLKEQTHNKGNQAYPAGYMAHTAIARSALYETATEAFTGKKEIGDIQPLKYGRIDGSHADTGLAEIKVLLGYNPVINDLYHFGFNAQLSIPTGNRSRAEYLFEPIYGNGHHWEFGLGFSAHATLWNSCDELSSCAFSSDLAISHLYTSRQRRSFDFKKNGALSRYMLVQEIGTPVIAGLTVDAQPATHQYHGKLMPAINISTFNTDISIAALIDLVFKCSYHYNNLDISAGYNLWARTAEQCHKRDALPHNCFALKGDAQLYGFIELANDQFVALNATESNATIHKGQGSGNIAKIDNTVINSFANSNVDNATLIELMGNGLVVDDTAAIFVSINGSNQSIILTNKDIDNQSGLSPASLSHTLFISSNYIWEKQHDITPFVGKGISVEWCHALKKTYALFSNWSLWIKGGICW